MPRRQPIDGLLKQHKRDLINLETRAARDLTVRWLQVERAWRPLISELAHAVAERARAGEAISKGIIYRLQLFSNLHERVIQELDKYGGYLQDRVARLQLRVSLLGVRLFDDLAEIAGYDLSFENLAREAIEQMAGNMADGSPIRSYFLANLHTETVERMAQTLVAGIAQGKNPREVARLMVDAGGIGHERALLIARTEMMRAWRETQNLLYHQTDYVTGWQWVATADRRTCPTCLMLDGRIFPVNQVQVDHPNGRCTSVPVFEGKPFFRELPASKWLASQPDVVKERIFGPGRWKLIKSGRASMEDVIVPRRHPTFGTHYGTATIEEMLENAERRRAQTNG